MTRNGAGSWTGLGNLIEKLSTATGVVGALAILAAALIVTEGVVVRKVFGISTIWQTEAAVFLLIYACFVGAALTQKRDAHLNVDLFIIHLGPRSREAVLLAANVISSLVCLILAYHAWPMWWKAVLNNEHSESLWGPALWIPYLFLPLGASLLCLQYLVQITRKIHDLKAGRIDETVVRTELRDVEIPGANGRESAHE